MGWHHQLQVHEAWLGPFQLRMTAQDPSTPQAMARAPWQEPAELWAEALNHGAEETAHSRAQLRLFNPWRRPLQQFNQLGPTEVETRSLRQVATILSRFSSANRSRQPLRRQPYQHTLHRQGTRLHIQRRQQIIF